ncbi:MAG TPA: NAD-binding protein, partial [Noviherbaspirillum sp.]
MHGNIVKLGGNFMIMAAIESMAESMTLGEKYGLPRQQMIDVLTPSIFAAPLFANYGRQIANHAYRPARFKFSLGFKDAGLVMAAADGVRLPMLLATLMQQRFQAGMAKGRGDPDWTAVALGMAENAGALVGCAGVPGWPAGLYNCCRYKEAVSGASHRASRPRQYKECDPSSPHDQNGRRCGRNCCPQPSQENPCQIRPDANSCR